MAQLQEDSGWTSIFIYPGYEFKCIDGMITNFHLPKSTLVMLVSALDFKRIYVSQPIKKQLKSVIAFLVLVMQCL